jgi:outer membrane receptor protein involved in Fe transport
MKFLPRNTYLYLNVGINNLLDNKNIPTGGFENPRFDYTGFDASKYASKYFYGFGRNYFINLSLKF